VATIRVVELVEAIKARIADPNRLTDMPDLQRLTRLPTATREELDEAQLKIGMALPPTLALLLREVANGGFGPGYGLLGVGSGGHRIEVADLDLNLSDFYRLLTDSDPRWDKDQIVIVDWGDVIWGTVSLSTGQVSTFRGDTDTYDEQHFEAQGVDLETWLMRWARGERVG